MSVLSKLIRNIAPKVAPIASLIPNPTAKVIGLGAGLIAQDTQQKQIKEAQEQEFSSMMDYSDFATSRGSVVVPDYRPNNQVNRAGNFFWWRH